MKANVKNPSRAFEVIEMLKVPLDADRHFILNPNPLTLETLQRCILQFRQMTRRETDYGMITKRISSLSQKADPRRRTSIAWYSMTLRIRC
jgi:hypothetical protein